MVGATTFSGSPLQIWSFYQNVVLNLSRIPNNLILIHNTATKLIISVIKMQNYYLHLSQYQCIWVNSSTLVINFNAKTYMVLQFEMCTQSSVHESMCPQFLGDGNSRKTGILSCALMFFLLFFVLVGNIVIFPFIRHLQMYSHLCLVKQEVYWISPKHQCSSKGHSHSHMFLIAS